jgi:hypothetical protein
VKYESKLKNKKGRDWKLQRKELKWLFVISEWENKSTKSGTARIIRRVYLCRSIPPYNIICFDYISRSFANIKFRHLELFNYAARAGVSGRGRIKIRQRKKEEIPRIGRPHVTRGGRAPHVRTVHCLCTILFYFIVVMKTEARRQSEPGRAAKTKGGEPSAQTSATRGLFYTCEFKAQTLPVQLPAGCPSQTTGVKSGTGSNPPDTACRLWRSGIMPTTDNPDPYFYRLDTIW